MLYRCLLPTHDSRRPVALVRITCNSRAAFAGCDLCRFRLPLVKHEPVGLQSRVIASVAPRRSGSPSRTSYTVATGMSYSCPESRSTRLSQLRQVRNRGDPREPRVCGACCFRWAKTAPSSSWFQKISQHDCSPKTAYFKCGIVSATMPRTMRIGVNAVKGANAWDLRLRERPLSSNQF